MSEKDNKIEEKELTEVSGGLSFQSPVVSKPNDFISQGPEQPTLFLDKENKINVP